MQIDKLGIPQFSERDLAELLQQGHIDKLADVLCTPGKWVEEFNSAADRFGNLQLRKHSPPLVGRQEFDEIMQSEWFMPDEYKDLDVDTYLMRWCSADDEIARVNMEMREFRARGMINVLRYMIYLVDFMQDNNILWGVGRGSSVASYVLYLIGVHRMNSIQYGLDFNEFMR
jgi:DNA polymerase III alpha subunit